MSAHPLPPSSTLRHLDDLTSPARNPGLVALMFNAIILLLFACLAFLIWDRPASSHLWIFALFAAALWLSVNYVLLQVVRIVKSEKVE
jgi:hypothetical protein